MSDVIFCKSVCHEAKAQYRKDMDKMYAVFSKPVNQDRLKNDHDELSKKAQLYYISGTTDIKRDHAAEIEEIGEYCDRCLQRYSRRNSRLKELVHIKGQAVLQESKERYRKMIQQPDNRDKANVQKDVLEFYLATCSPDESLSRELAGQLISFMSSYEDLGKISVETTLSCKCGCTLLIKSPWQEISIAHHCYETLVRFVDKLFALVGSTRFLPQSDAIRAVQKFVILESSDDPLLIGFNIVEKQIPEGAVELHCHQDAIVEALDDVDPTACQSSNII